MLKRLTPEYIFQCSYTDFVGLVNQTNVPPGSFSTLTEWITNGFITAESHLVEVACTTGFSIREISRLTGCSGEGVDLSEVSIDRATTNTRDDFSDGRLRFVSGDATLFVPKKKATHVIVGAALGFFPKPKMMLDQLTQFFTNDRGYLLAAPFYVTSSVPHQLIDEARNVLGISPTVAPYKEVMRLYSNFSIRYECRHIPVQETKEEIHHYCISTISRASKELNDDRPEIFSAMYDRLFTIRELTNSLRQYQGYSVLVLGYNKCEFGNRYVELF